MTPAAWNALLDRMVTAMACLIVVMAVIYFAKLYIENKSSGKPTGFSRLLQGILVGGMVIVITGGCMAMAGEVLFDPTDPSEWKYADDGCNPRIC